jgi:hypothetical protein
VVRLVVETPLANDQVGAGVLDLPDHRLESLELVLLQLLELLDRGNVELVLRLRTRGLERAGEDSDFGVLDGTGHLRVRHVLVEEDTADEGCVLEGATDLAGDLDEVERNVATVEVGNGENGVDGDLGEERVCFRDAVGM